MKKLLFITCILFSFHFAFSQKDISTKPFISAGFDVIPHRQMTDSTGSFTSKSLYLKFSIPLYKKTKLLEEIKKTSYFQLNVAGGFNFTRPEFDFSYFSIYHDLYNAAFGLNAYYFKSYKNLFLSQVHASFSEDNYTVNTPEPRLTGFTLYHRIASDHFGYHAGFVCTYAFGKAYILPVIGISSTFNNKTRLNITLPVKVSLMYKPDPQTYISLYLKPNGLVSRFSSNNILNEPAGETLIYRQTQFQTGVSLFYNPPARVAILVKTGMDFYRRMQFGDDNTIINTRLKPTIFVSLNVIYKLIKKKDKEVRKTKNELLLDDLLEQISPENIE